MLFNSRAVKIILCFLLVLAGIFTFITVQTPSKTGLIGQGYYSTILIPFFGHGSKLIGYYLIICGALILVTSKQLLRITGVTLIMLPVMTWTDNYYITEVFPAQSALNHFMRSSVGMFIGNAGLLLVELVFVIFGTYLLLYKTDLKPSSINLFRRSIPGSEPESKEKMTEEEPEEIDEVEAEIKPLPKKQPLQPKLRLQGEKEEPAGRKVILNLKPYRKAFQKPKISDFKKQPADSVSYGEKKERIKEVFLSLGVEVNVGTVIGGPSVEQYEIIPGKGVKLSQIRKLDEDLSLALKSKVLITFNTQGALCVEAPMAKRRTVFFRRLLETATDTEAKLPVILGVNASYETYSFDLAELPHLLIAGTTGSGKSILVKTLLASIMYNLTPNDVRLVLVDPKRVDFGIFNASPFMACKVITDMEDASFVLQTLVDEMEDRYDLLERSNASNIASYNQSAKAGRQLPYIIAVVDEFADLIMGDKSDIGDNIIRIAQKARACGIHLILATQRPSAEVISGLIKANVPGKIALSVSSAINSKIIIDRTGAEKLLGKGDMIFISPELKDGVRLQGAFISDDEIMKFMK
ncbi:DUF87 domain-containing protein [bacterium]|nr:DUF87 domain-containing protein [bacterium]